MTNEQRDIKVIYRICLYVIAICFCLGVCFKVYRKVFKVFVGYSKEIGDASATPWRDVKGADIFLPNITHLALAAPILVADVDDLPAAYSPTIKSRGWEEVINPRVLDIHFVLMYHKGTPIMDEYPGLAQLPISVIQVLFYTYVS